MIDLIKSLHWEKGRQETGYWKAAVRIDDERLKVLVERSLKLIGQSDLQSFDCYILKYPTGSLIPPHKDKGSVFGSEHWRLNALIADDHTGGELMVEKRPIKLFVGDAIVFRPDDLLHSVSEITNGTRYMWSVGTML